MPLSRQFKPIKGTVQGAEEARMNAEQKFADYVQTVLSHMEIGC